MSRFTGFLAVAGLLAAGGAFLVQGNGAGTMGGQRMSGGGGTMGGSGPGHGPGEMRGMMRNLPRAARDRRQAFMNGPADRWMDRTIPLAPTEANLTAGAEIYAAQCAYCHGPYGQGTTETAKTLDIPPTRLTTTAGQTPPGFLAWTIAVGGAPTGSAMPAFEAALDDNALWQVVLHLRDKFGG